MKVDQTWWNDPEAPFPEVMSLDLDDSLHSLLACCPFFEGQAAVVLKVLLEHDRVLSEGHRNYISKHTEQTFAWFPEVPRQWIVDLFMQIKRDPKAVWFQKGELEKAHSPRQTPNDAMGKMAQALEDSNMGMKLPSAAELKAGANEDPSAEEKNEEKRPAATSAILPEELRATLRKMRKAAEGAGEAGKNLKRIREERERSSGSEAKE